MNSDAKSPNIPAPTLDYRGPEPGPDIGRFILGCFGGFVAACLECGFGLFIGIMASRSLPLPLAIALGLALPGVISFGIVIHRKSGG